MNVEQPAVQIRNAANESFNIRISFLASQRLVKESEKEVAVEGVELVLAVLGTHLVESIAEIVSVPTQKTFPLNEVNEHQAVECNGGIPLLIGAIADTADELQKRLVLLLEPVVEAFGDPLDIKPGSGAAGDVGQ